MTAPEPDLQEHQRLIDRALTQTAVRHIARQAGHPAPGPARDDLAGDCEFVYSRRCCPISCWHPAMKHPPDGPMTPGNMTSAEVTD
jgi:hypothetical protein